MSGEKSDSGGGSKAAIIIAIIGLVGTLGAAFFANLDKFRSQPPRDGITADTTRSDPGLMGALQRGIGYDHDDLDPKGWLTVASAEACSDLCYAEPKCRAMTYVISNRTCWLKYAVPDPTPNSDMVSAVRRQPAN